MVKKSKRISEGDIPPLPKFEFTHQLLVLLEFYQSGHNPHGRLKYDKEKCKYPKCRYLVTEDIKGQYYKVYNKHPRFKIPKDE